MQCYSWSGVRHTPRALSCILHLNCQNRTADQLVAVIFSAINTNFTFKLLRYFRAKIRFFRLRRLKNYVTGMFMFCFRPSRRRMMFALQGLARLCALPCSCMSRRRLPSVMVASAGAIFTLTLFASYIIRMPKEELMEERLAAMQVHIQYLDSQYRTRHEELITLQNKLLVMKNKLLPYDSKIKKEPPPPLPPDVAALARNQTGTKTAAGLSSHREPLRTPFLYHLMPHLLNDSSSLRPAYHMTAGRTFVNIVVGVPTVKRDKESYLMITLTHLVNSLTKEEANSTLIVVMVGETDLYFVLQTAMHIEMRFPQQVADGLIEVISPSAAFYPELDSITPTLGDSAKRAKWRTKQNLDAIFLMAYAQPKGIFYLMLEDDIIAKDNYMKEITSYISSITVTNPQWLILEFCQIGGIGKLFRSANLFHFITYVQLFYTNMPIDWLIESYLMDVACSIVKSGKQCTQGRLEIRPKYRTSLFQHIGLYSSLKGKLHKSKDTKYGPIQNFYPNLNPPLASIHTDMDAYNDHTLKKAYDGETFFWGRHPRRGNTLEFIFEKPTNLKSVLFRSGNIDHVSDKFYSAVIELLPARKNGSYVEVADFDEFGIGEVEVKKELCPLAGVRVRVTRDSTHWLVVSEIQMVSDEFS